MNGLDEIQKFGQESMDRALKSFGAVSQGFQSIAVEVADYSKRSIDEGTSALESLLAARSFDKALEVQADYARQAYAGLVDQLGKLGEIYAGIARDAYRPFENGFAGAARR